MAEAGSGSGVRGQLLSLRALGSGDLPPHGELGGSEGRRDVGAFLRQLLSEAAAEDFAHFKKIGSAKSEVANSQVVVEKFKHEENHLTWFARKSVHDVDKPVSFEELDGVVRKDHDQNEVQYTPNLYDANRLLEWDLKGETFEGLREVDMKIIQMHHGMPAGLSDRVFTALLVSFINDNPPTGSTAESIDFQIPMDWHSLPDAIKARSHVHVTGKGLSYKNDDASASPTQKSKNGKEVVEGAYVSLEKISKGESGTTTWWMKTASDAKGNLPAWLQKLGVPGAIVKDVPLALGFIVKKRNEGGS